MFGEQEVLIPSMLLCSCSLCDSPNSSTCVVSACGLEKSKGNLLVKKDSFVNAVDTSEIGGARKKF